ncbi:hypothetical protein KIL84_019895 [Mauremys mutica]|uniref:Uncharacterized protein n=1 Tax=Mauremys mutica TaxID=74926 RepID=A0A9D3XXA2_9SAUR|nr:hypothetical protein KIL84_019895 [Mauremys mutica]
MDLHYGQERLACPEPPLARTWPWLDVRQPGFPSAWGWPGARPREPAPWTGQNREQVLARAAGGGHCRLGRSISALSTEQCPQLLPAASSRAARAWLEPASPPTPPILLRYTPHRCCPPWTLLPQHQRRGPSPPTRASAAAGLTAGHRPGGGWPCSRAVTGDPGILLTARAWLRPSSPWA